MSRLGMKRLRRWLFNALAALSLLLLVVILAIWLRCMWMSDRFNFNYLSGATTADKMLKDITFFIQGGGICYDYTRWPVYPNRHVVAMGYRHDESISEPYLYAANVWRLRTPQTFTVTSRSLMRIGRFGVQYTIVNSPNPNSTVETHFTVSMPLWFLMAIFLPIPLAWDIRHRRRHRARLRGHTNLCLNCGYDLRATPDRCPECGAIPPKIQAPEPI